MENKHINIIGTNNRYQLKKIIQSKPEIKLKHNSIVDTETITCFNSSELQKKILLDSLSYPKEYLLIIRELKKKITSYKQQVAIEPLISVPKVEATAIIWFKLPKHGLVTQSLTNQLT